MPSLLLREVVDPIPAGEFLPQSGLTATQQQVAGNSLDCIALPDPAPLNPAQQNPADSISVDLPPTFCLAVGSNVLRLSYNHGAPVLLRSAIGSFQGHSVPLDLVASLGTVKLATAHLATLETLPTIDPALLAPTPDLDAVHPAVQVDARVMDAARLTGEQPVYPADYKQGGVYVLLLRLLIGSDGRVKDVTPLRSPVPSMTDAAFAAVRTWTYKPYLLNGAPTDVLTTATVTFKKLNLRTYPGNRPGIGGAPSPHHP